MPRTNGGTGPFVLNPIYLAIPGTTILATQHNTPLEDIEDTFNIPQPIAYGGTQAATPRAAMDNLFIVGANATSAGTLDLDNTTGTFVAITGTTTVTAVALAEGKIRYGRATAALPFTASATLIVNGSATASYTCEAGDMIMFVGEAAATVRVWVLGRNKFIASQFTLADGTDQTKTAKFDASGISTATERTYGLPDASGTLALTSDLDAVDEQIDKVSTCNGRLTLTTGVAVTTADVTGAGTIYFTPYNGNRIGLYSGTSWVVHEFSELSIAFSGGTAALPHDLFLYDNSGTLTLDLVAWTNNTTRAVALVLQDGVYVKSGATGRRYLGTIYLDGSKQCEDSLTRRMVQNAYNRLPRPMRVLDSTDSWTYTTAAWRQAGGNAANQLQFVVGLDEYAVEATVSAVGSNSAAASFSASIGLDGSSAPAAGALPAIASSSGTTTLTAMYRGFAGLGGHTLFWLEYSNASGTTTWYGDAGTTVVQSGMIGEVYA